MNQELFNKKSAPRSLRSLVDMRIAGYVTARAKKSYDLRKHKMAVFANDHIGIMINQFGFFELEELTDLFEFLKPLHTAFRAASALDIGANIGNHSLFFAQYFSCVHSFEPNPSTFHLLDFNVHQARNVVAHRTGLGDAAGAFELMEDPTNMGLSSLKYITSTTQPRVQIQVVRLDDINLDAADIAFMKIDVEGFESNVIRGGVDTLRRYQPLVVMEQHENEFEDGTTPSIRLLQELDYSFCWHINSGESASWIMRRLHNAREMLFGRRNIVRTAARVPRRNYTMLIAVPPRFKAALGI